ncbi:hypothetical protein VNO77_28948 [Canavalia gladiata]|uniref:Reverse transcriptase n=1 Tax=Canavalia gladiata TaxID=3824 RepID=A0AAN9KX82_CANGL
MKNGRIGTKLAAWLLGLLDDILLDIDLATKNYCSFSCSYGDCNKMALPMVLPGNNQFLRNFLVLINDKVIESHSFVRIDQSKDLKLNNAICTVLV